MRSCKSGFSHSSGEQPQQDIFQSPFPGLHISPGENAFLLPQKPLVLGLRVWPWKEQKGSPCVAACVQHLARGKQRLRLANTGQETVAAQQQVIHKPPGSHASCTSQEEVDGKQDSGA